MGLTYRCVFPTPTKENFTVIHLVDDDVAVTDACRFLLESIDCAVTCWNNSDAFLREANLYEPGVVLLDMRMPGKDGHEVYSELRRLQSTLAVIFLTGHGDIQMAVEQMKQGAVDFLEKPVSAPSLFASLNKANTLSAAAFHRYVIQQRYNSLTPKEQAIALRVIQGDMNKTIAQQLNIAIRTVEVHRARVMEKLGARSLAELVTTLQELK
ncbi:MAG: response regulator [Yokenella regensburgei]|uniref:tetrathionate respiration response regulator TtrR n=1 Tax=Yokenella regensburgei TaxID=158877 RepID=UPI000DD88C02|nr:tetrathionate respiration response regulator TtrR [Yokenella regensburgei]MDR3103748.1 response regulator [Yokenella regensburgei]